ncbi:MAG: ribosome assembly cofactor RimP [Bacteroidales bacterium]
MIDKNFISDLVDEFLKDHPDLFLVELKVSSSSKIAVFLDGDEGVPVSKCIDLSRFIENKLDRDQEDFELEVSSVGVSKPLVMPRQFIKNTGREIEFTTSAGEKIKATLVAADHKGVVIEKEIKKKKKPKPGEPVEEPIQNFTYQDIDNAVVQVSFKKEKQKKKK